MRATFMNKLAFAEHGQESIIRYNHHFRVDVGIYIKRKQMKDRDWDLYFSNGNPVDLPSEIKDGLVREFILYVKRRARKGVNTLCFGDLVELTRTMNIA